MLLSDRDIQASIEADLIGVEPFDPGLLQPASLDVRLSNLYRVPAFELRHIDVAAVPEDHTVLFDADDNDGAIQLRPGEFLLGCTAEIVTIGSLHAARFEGKSSLARLGLAVHVTGGFIDPGFRGQITVEIANLAAWALTLRAGMRIGQLAFHHLSSPPTELYGGIGHYQGQMGPTESRFRYDAPVSA